MAFPTICPECQQGHHDKCLKSGWNAPEGVVDGLYPDGELWFGAALCVCTHGPEPTSPFEASVRDRLASR